MLETLYVHVAMCKLTTLLLSSTSILLPITTCMPLARVHFQATECPIQTERSQDPLGSPVSETHPSNYLMSRNS